MIHLPIPGYRFPLLRNWSNTTNHPYMRTWSTINTNNTYEHDFISYHTWYLILYACLFGMPCLWFLDIMTVHSPVTAGAHACVCATAVRPPPAKSNRLCAAFHFGVANRQFAAFKFGFARYREQIEPALLQKCLITLGEAYSSVCCWSRFTVATNMCFTVDQFPAIWHKKWHFNTKSGL